MISAPSSLALLLVSHYWHCRHSLHHKFSHHTPWLLDTAHTVSFSYTCLTLRTRVIHIHYMACIQHINGSRLRGINELTFTSPSPNTILHAPMYHLWTLWQVAHIDRHETELSHHRPSIFLPLGVITFKHRYNGPRPRYEAPLTPPLSTWRETIMRGLMSMSNPQPMT